MNLILLHISLFIHLNVILVRFHKVLSADWGKEMSAHRRSDAFREEKMRGVNFNGGIRFKTTDCVMSGRRCLHMVTLATCKSFFFPACARNAVLAWLFKLATLRKHLSCSKMFAEWDVRGAVNLQGSFSSQHGKWKVEFQSDQNV